MTHSGDQMFTGIQSILTSSQISPIHLSSRSQLKPGSNGLILFKSSLYELAQHIFQCNRNENKYHMDHQFQFSQSFDQFACQTQNIHTIVSEFDEGVKMVVVTPSVGISRFVSKISRTWVKNQTQFQCKQS